MDRTQPTMAIRAFLESFGPSDAGVVVAVGGASCEVVSTKQIVAGKVAERVTSVEFRKTAGSASVSVIGLPSCSRVTVVMVMLVSAPAAVTV